VKEQSLEGKEKEEKGRGKGDENSLKIPKYSKIAATRFTKLLKICHLIENLENFKFYVAVDLYFTYIHKISFHGFSSSKMYSLNAKHTDKSKTIEA